MTAMELGNLAAGREPFTYFSQLTSAVSGCPDSRADRPRDPAVRRNSGFRVRTSYVRKETMLRLTVPMGPLDLWRSFTLLAVPHTSAVSCAGRLSMKELTEKTALPGPEGP
jgi:hypothetical protein